MADLPVKKVSELPTAGALDLTNDYVPIEQLGAAKKVSVGTIRQNDASKLTTGTLPAARLLNTDILSKVKEVDGAGSGLDADLLDGIDSVGFVKNESAPGNSIYIRNNLGNPAIKIDATDYGTIWTASNDGTASGLDADLLDGKQGSHYETTALLKTTNYTVAELDAAGKSVHLLNGDINPITITMPATGTFYFVVGTLNQFVNPAGNFSLVSGGSVIITRYA